MTAYTSTRPGPPRQGRFSIGDTVTDSEGVVWMCARAGFATGGAAFGYADAAEFVPSVDADAVTTHNVGAKNGATVSVVEGGNGLIHKTTFTLTATPVTVTDEAGVAQWGGTAKLYTFPAGQTMTLGAVMAGNLTLGTTGTIIDAFTGVNSLGTAARAATGAATLVGTAADILQSTANATASSKVAAIDSVSVATALTESGARHFDGTATAKELYLNFAIADDASHTSGTGSFTGTIQLVWVLLGDN